MSDDNNNNLQAFQLLVGQVPTRCQMRNGLGINCMSISCGMEDNMQHGAYHTLDIVGSGSPGIPEVSAAAQLVLSLDGDTCAAGLEVWLLCIHQEALHHIAYIDMVLLDYKSSPTGETGWKSSSPDTPVASALLYRLPVCSFAWSRSESTKAARCLKWNPSFSTPFKASLQHHSIRAAGRTLCTQTGELLTFQTRKPGLVHL